MSRLRILALAIPLVGLASLAPADVRTIEIAIEHSRFDPHVVEVRAGERVRFVVHNGDPIDHEFILGDDVVQQIHEEGTEAHHGAKPGEVSVAAFGTAETTFEFADEGRLIIGCHLPGHYDYGMRAEVVVRG